jgi:hypothetical protein
LDRSSIHISLKISYPTCYYGGHERREIAIPDCLTDSGAITYYCEAMRRLYAEQDQRYARGERRVGTDCEGGAEASALEVALRLQHHEEIPLADCEALKLFGLAR